MEKIVIDPGHGGSVKVGGSSPNNAVGPTGLLEKNVTLEVAKRIKARAAGVEVVLTRSNDTNLGLADRAKFAKDLRAPVFVSVHFNGWPTPDVQRTETYIHATGSADSLRLAKLVQAKVLAATGLLGRDLQRAEFGVLNPSNHYSGTAACLVEISFMTQAAEEARLKTAAYLDKLADAVIEAAKAYIAARLLGSAEAFDDQVSDLPLAPGDEDAAKTNLDPR